MTACSPSPVLEPTFNVTPQTLALEAGANAVPLTATVQNSSAEVKWALEGEGTLSSLKGKITNYTPPATLNTALSAKITTTLEGTKLSQLVNVTLTPKPKLVITPPTDLSNVVAGGPKIRFSVTVLNGQTKKTRTSVRPAPMWSLEGPGSLDPFEGNFTDYTPPADVNTPLPVKLTVRLGTLEQTFSFNIQPKPLVAALSLSPSSQTITAGTVGTAFTATLFNSTEVLSWSLTGLGTLSSNVGKTVTYTPPSSVTKTETATLTVRAGALSQQATLTLQPAPKLSVLPSSATFTAGDTGQSFTATLENSSEPINWTLEGVGSLSSITDKTVVYTPPSSVTKEETVKLTARAGVVSEVSLLIKPNPANPANQILQGNLLDASNPSETSWKWGIVELQFIIPITSFTTTPYDTQEFGITRTDANGRFTFLLPSEGQLPFFEKPLAKVNPNCDSNFTVNPSDLATSIIAGIKMFKDGKLISYINADDPYWEPFNRRNLVYSQQAGSVKGSIICVSGTLSESYIFDVNLVKGWNIGSNARSITGSSTIYTQTAIPLSLLTYYTTIPSN